MHNTLNDLEDDTNGNQLLRVINLKHKNGSI